MAKVATTKITFGAVLAAVQTSAQSVVNVLDVGNTLVAKAQLAASDSLRSQKIESIMNNESTKDKLVINHAKDLVELQMEVAEFTKKSTEHATLFKSNYDKYAALVANI